MADLPANNPIALSAADQPTEVPLRRRIDLAAPVVAPGSGPGDLTVPTVTLVSPASSLEPETPIVFEATDNAGLRRVFVVARFPSLGLEEVVHQGDRFAAKYAASSSRVSITNGWRFSIRRAGGWLADPVIEVYAIDTSGLEA